MKYALPPQVSFTRQLQTLFRPGQNAIEIITKQMEHYGDSYTVNSPLLDNPIIFTRDAKWTQYILKKSYKEMDKSPFQTDILAKYIGKGLLTNTGEDWMRQRRLIQPAFKNEHINELVNLMETEIELSLQQLPIHHDFDVYPHLNALTFQIMAKTLFGNQVDISDFDELSTTITYLQNVYTKETRSPFFKGWYSLIGTFEKCKSKTHRVKQIISKAIDDFDALENPHTLLAHLQSARYEDTGEPMTQEVLIDEILILLVAGHETSACSLAFTLYLLGKHPEEQQKLYNWVHTQTPQEILSGMFQPKPNPLTNCLKESMRLYPPAWIIDRVSLDGDEFGTYTYPKNTIIMTVVYALHRNPNYFSNPDSFIPERFSDPNSKSLPYYPFGLGQRLCIGSHFAMLEMQLFVKAFIERFQVKTKTQQLELLPMVTMRPKELYIAIQSRL